MNRPRHPSPFRAPHAGGSHGESSEQNPARGESVTFDRGLAAPCRGPNLLELFDDRLDAGPAIVLEEHNIGGGDGSAALQCSTRARISCGNGRAMLDGERSV
jgi:hypothetical protein